MLLILENIKSIIVAGLITLGIFLTFFQFTNTPKVWVDEGVFTEVSRNFAEHGVLGIQTSPGSFFTTEGFVLSTSYPVIFPVALSLKLFGVGLWQARLPMVLYILLFFILSFLLVRKRYGFYPAVFSTLFLLSFSPIYGNGRPVQGEVPGLFFLVLGVYFLLYLEESGFVNKKWAIWAGLALGLASSTKALYLTFITVAIILFIIFWYKKIDNKKIFLYFSAGYLAPIILWFFIHFGFSVSFFEIVKSYLYFAGSHGTGLSVFDTVVKNILRFFTESTPVLFGVTLGVVFISLIIKYKKNKKDFVSGTELFLLFFIILNLIGYLKGVGWYRYFFPANALAYIIFPPATIYIISILESGILKKIIQCMFLGLLVFQFYHLVFLSDTSFVVKRTRNEDLSSALSNIDKTKSILFYNMIHAVVFYKGSNYSQYLQMEDFLIAGDKDSILKPKYDYILTDMDPGDNLGLSCYSKKQVSSYYLFERRLECK